MRMKLHRAAGGRARIYMLTHGRGALWRLLLVGVLTGALAHHYTSTLADSATRVGTAEQRAKKAEAELHAHMALSPTEPVVFVIEARTPRELQLRLADIAGRLDAARGEIPK